MWRVKARPLKRWAMVGLTLESGFECRGLGPAEKAEDLKSARKATERHVAANSAKLTRCKFNWLHRRCIVMSLPMQHVVFGHTADTAILTCFKYSRLGLNLLQALLI
jgi:hypothetical protein